MILWPFGLHIVLAVTLAAAMPAMLFVLSSRLNFRRSSPVLAPRNTNITRHRRWSEALPTIQRFLSPVGFPASCGAMAPFVCSAAPILAAKLTLLCVLDPPTSGCLTMFRR